MKALDLEKLQGFDFVTVAIPRYSDPSIDEPNLSAGVLHAGCFVSLQNIERYSKGVLDSEHYEKKTRDSLLRRLAEEIYGETIDSLNK